jgi:hypothetical protein
VRTRRHPAVATWVFVGLQAYLSLWVYLLEPGWEAWSLLPAAALAWFVATSGLRLQRVAMASVLSVAEALGMTIVGQPDALRRPAAADRAAGRATPAAP